MKFHKERMSIINNLVREMWYNTYKGKDIDYIEIKAEETSAIGKSAAVQLLLERWIHIFLCRCQRSSSVQLPGGYAQKRRGNGYERTVQCRPESVGFTNHPHGFGGSFQFQMWSLGPG